MHPKAACFNQNYSENRNIVKYYYYLKQLISILIYFKMLIYSSDGKAEFSASLL